MQNNPNKLIDILINGGVAVIPTDTIYGIVGSATNPKTVQRIYNLKKRTPTKASIILIASVDDLRSFGIKLSTELSKALYEYWPGPVSIILDCHSKKYEYLHRGTNSLAFRLPDNIDLQNILKQTGPLIAPSANSEGMPPATNIDEARGYFGDGVDIYISGVTSDKASKIIKISDNLVTIIRP